MAVTWERLAYRDDVILKDGIVDDGSIFIKEKAAAAADVASYGQLWVKNNTPNELWFTDDAGTDVQLGIAGASGNPLTVGTDDTTVGTFIAYGGGAGADGGVLKLYLGSDDDGAGIAEQFYAIQVVEDDLFIGGDADTNALKLSSGGDLFVTAGTISCSDLTDGYIPYHVNDASGLANGPIWTDGTKVGIGTATVPHGGVGKAMIAFDGVAGSWDTLPITQITTSTDDYPVMQSWFAGHTSWGFGFDIYYDGFNWRSSSTSSNLLIERWGEYLIFYNDTGIAQGSVSDPLSCGGLWMQTQYPPLYWVGSLYVGYNYAGDRVRTGSIQLAGNPAAGASLGSALSLGIAADYDTTHDFWLFAIEEDDIWLYNAHPGWKFLFSMENYLWISSVGGDPRIIFAPRYDGGNGWGIGNDISDSYKFKISKGGTLGTGDILTIDASGNVGIRTSGPVCPLEVEDNATGASILVKITQDDANVYGLVIGNDTYSATDTNGLLFKVADTGAPTISWTAGVLTLSGGDVTIGSNANVNYSIKFDSSQSDGTITYQSAASDGYFYFNTPGLKLLAFGSFNTTGDTYFYASRSAVNYGVVKWDAVQDNVGNTDLWINTGFANDKGVSIGYDSSLYPARTVATLDVRRIVNSTSSYGILYLQNDCDANPTIPYPVLRTDRYIEGHWMASLSISIAQWEDTGIAARSDIRFGLTHGNATYPDANILSLRSDGLVTIGDGAAGTDYILKFDGETNDGTITWMEDEAQFKFSNVLRTATSLYRRYYHIALSSANPGASGATWIDPGANSTGGWRIDAASEVLHGSTDVHSDWDGATDLTVEIRFYVNVNNTGGGAGDTVDLKAVFYYKGVGDTVTKTQTVEVATVVGASAQYKAFEADFTINWDEVSNVVEAGDVIGMLLNLETDTSEVDDIVVTGISFSYPTTHLGIEAGDT